MFVDLVQRKKYGGHQIDNVKIPDNEAVKGYWKSTKKCVNLSTYIVEHFAYITLTEILPDTYKPDRFNQ